MAQRGSAWSVTMNMKTISRERCEDYIGMARQLGWTIEGQIEQGAEGTQHYQLLVRTPQCRFSALKKAFPTAHIEVARNVSALKTYVHKEDTRVEELKEVENKFVTWKEVRNKFFDWYVETYPDNLEYHIDDCEKMKHWDRFIRISICEGIECDVLGVNPQYRSCVMKYWTAYITCALDSIQEPLDKFLQDRQESRVVIPTTDA